MMYKIEIKKSKKGKRRKKIKDTASSAAEQRGIPHCSPGEDGESSL